MKNQFVFKLLKLTLVMVFILFVSSCQDETDFTENVNQINEKISSDETNFKKATEQTSFKEGASDCSTECIEVGEESGATTTNAAYNPSKSVDVLISNTSTDVIFKFSSAESIHYITIDGVQKFCSADDNDDDPIDQATYSIAIPIGEFGVDWNGCDTKSFDMVIYRNNCVGNGGGNNATFTASHNLVPVCVCDDESFSVEATNDNLDLLFTYDAATALVNATVKFTFPQVMNFLLVDGKYTAPDGKEYSVNNLTNQTVFTWIGDIACTDEEAETFSFSHLPDCGKGNANDGEALIWTDMKVNEVSVKDGISNIKYLLCPIPVKD